MNVDREKWFQVGSHLQNLFSDTQRGDLLLMHSQAVGSYSLPDNKSEKQPIPLSVERV